MPGAGRTFHLTQPGEHKQCDTLAWPYSMSAPVTFYENKQANGGTMLPPGISKQELDTYRVRIGSGVSTCPAASSPVFDHIASGPNEHLITEDLKATLNGWRTLAKSGAPDAAQYPVMLKGGSAIEAAYNEVEAELIKQHEAYTRSLVVPTSFVVKAKTHVAPSLGVPPAEFVHHTATAGGAAIGTPIDGYFHQLPSTHSIGFCLKLTYAHPQNAAL